MADKPMTVMLVREAGLQFTVSGSQFFWTASRKAEGVKAKNGSRFPVHSSKNGLIG
jgi:hypothetical protein